MDKYQLDRSIHLNPFVVELIMNAEADKRLIHGSSFSE